VTVEPRAAQLQPPGSRYPLIPQDAPIKIGRDVYKKEVYLKRIEAPNTYLIFRGLGQEPHGGELRHHLRLRDAFDPTSLRKGRYVGFAASTAEESATEVRFVQKVNVPGSRTKSAASSHEVVIRPQDQPALTFVGNTDRRGPRRHRPTKRFMDANGETSRHLRGDPAHRAHRRSRTFRLVPGDEPFARSTAQLDLAPAGH